MRLLNCFLLPLLLVTAVSAQTPVVLEEAKLLAPAPQPNRTFGRSVALSANGEIAFVGAHFGAYFYRRSAEGQWLYTDSLYRPVNNFGHAVALSGAADLALVGATGLNAGQGGGFVFRYDGQHWAEEAVLVPIGGPDHVGQSAAISADGQVAVLGGVRSSTPTTGAGGAAYVFRRDAASGQWAQEVKLFASDGQTFHEFGMSVALSADGSVALVGASGDAGNHTGWAYVFRRNQQGQWTQEQRLLASDGQIGDYFGLSVSLSADGSLALVGASNADTAAGANAGSTYVFRYEGTSWVEQAKIEPSDAQANNRFGVRVALSAAGTFALIGAHLTDTGRAYSYRFEEGEWVEQAKLLPSEGNAGDFFGVVALSATGERALVGAERHDAGAVDTGAAYVFDLSAFVPVATEAPAVTRSSSLAVYPNPSAGRATVALNLVAQPEAVRVVVYDVLGREVRRLAEGVVASRSVDVEGLAPGLYLVAAEGGGWRQSARLVVAR
jgi:hypothetical protein